MNLKCTTSYIRDDRLTMRCNHEKSEMTEKRYSGLNDINKEGKKQSQNDHDTH